MEITESQRTFVENVIVILGAFEEVDRRRIVRDDRPIVVRLTDAVREPTEAELAYVAVTDDALRGFLRALPDELLRLLECLMYYGRDAVFQSSSEFRDLEDVDEQLIRDSHDVTADVIASKRLDLTCRYMSAGLERATSGAGA